MTRRSEFDTPDRTLSTERARQSFLEAVSRLAPYVLEELRGAPLQVFTQGRASLAPYDLLSLKEFSQSPPLRNPGLETIQKAVEAWATTWHLSTPWVLGVAYKTLEVWRSGDKLEGFYPIDIYFSSAISITEREMFPDQLALFFKAARFMGFEPTQKPESEFREETNALFKLFLNEHIDKQKRKALNHPKYPGKHKLESHLKWAVLKQIYGYSAEDISSTLGLNRLSVKKALDDIFELIRLEPRRLPAGRPKSDESKDERKERVEAEIRKLLL